MGFSSSKTFGFGAPALPGSAGTDTEVLVSSVTDAPHWEPGVRWQRLLHVNFSLLPDQDFAADGPVTLGSGAFVVRNFANRYLATTMGITAGKGLKLPNPVSAQVGSNRMISYCDMPELVWPFPTVIRNGIPVRAAMRVHSVENSPSGFPTLGFLCTTTTRLSGQALALNGLVDAWNYSTVTGDVKIDGAVSNMHNSASAPNNLNVVGLHAPDGIGPTKQIETLVGNHTETPVTSMGDLLVMGSFAGRKYGAGCLATATAEGNVRNWGLHLATCVASTLSGSIYIAEVCLEARVGIGE